MDSEPVSDGNPKIQALAERLAPLWDAAGVPRPDLTALQGPEIRLEEPIEKVCQRVVEIVGPRQTLFVRNQNELGTVDPESGTWEPMHSARFVTWLCRQGITITESNPRARNDENAPLRRCVDLPEQKARLILASDTLVKNLPPLRALNETKLPVYRKELDERDDGRRKGFHKVELLPIGYDVETGFYTLPGRDFDENMHPEDAVKLIDRLIRYFPWADENRKAGHVSAMLTTFCKNLFVGRSPMFLYNAPLEGTGKSRLAELAFRPVLPVIGNFPANLKDESKVDSMLDTIAREGKAAIWIDNFPKGYKLKHSPLLAFLTSSFREGRVLGHGHSFRVPVSTVVYATGTQIESEGENRRRMIFIDLLSKQKCSEKELPADAVLIDDDFFRDPAWMAEIRAALWALVRNWDENHRPGPESKLLASFEGWSRVVPAMVSAACFGDPLAPYDVIGDEGKDIEMLAGFAIKKFALNGDGKVTLADLAELARTRELLPDTLGHLDLLVSELDRNRNHSWELPHDGILTDGEKRRQAARFLEKSTETKFGRLLKHHGLIGREIRCDGRIWQFGHRRQAKGVRWTITEVNPESPEPEA
jgi:hypothetical protein